MKVEYDSNNSGGHWWLTDADWLALENAGWKVDWIKDDPNRSFKDACKTRFLGALATKAYRTGLSLQDAVDEWENITGENSTDVGCECCGQPHYFTLYDDDGNYVTSGPEVRSSVSW